MADETHCSLSAKCLRTGAFAVLLGLQCATAHAAQSLVQEQFVAELNALRARGCEGRPGVAIPLAGEERLHRAAELSPPAKGRSVEVLAGFRAVRWAVIRIQGISDLHRVPAAVARVSCNRLLETDFTAVGFHHAGRQVTIVFAMPFVPPAAGMQAAVAERVLQLVNEARSQPRSCGEKDMPAAPPLSYSPVLASVARAYSEDMAQHSYMAHRGRDGSMVNDRVNRTGYRWRSLAENLASGQATPEQAVRGWLNSPGHCASLMDARYRETGVGYAYNETSLDGMYWTQLFALPR
jgi:uncharacterized protein YkwD